MATFDSPLEKVNNSLVQASQEGSLELEIKPRPPERFSSSSPSAPRGRIRRFVETAGCREDPPRPASAGVGGVESREDLNLDNDVAKLRQLRWCTAVPP